MSAPPLHDIPLHPNANNLNGLLRSHSIWSNRGPLASLAPIIICFARPNIPIKAKYNSTNLLVLPAQNLIIRLPYEHIYCGVPHGYSSYDFSFLGLGPFRPSGIVHAQGGLHAFGFQDVLHPSTYRCHWNFFSLCTLFSVDNSANLSW